MQITESAGTLTPKGGVMRVQIITEGIGASGVYPAATLEAAAEARVFHKGLHVHFDHPTVSEATERPERSVLTLAGSLTSDAEWNADTKALEADFKPYPSVYDSIKERAEDIGLSIRAAAEVEDDGTIARIVSAESVDLVTKAGRGGRILDVIESARREIAERNGLDYQPRHAVSEATDNDVRRYLSDAVDATHEADDRLVFLEDFDDTYVYVRLTRWEENGPHYRSEFRQTYSLDGVNVTLTGTPEEVKPETVYTPTNPEPDTPSPAAAVETRSTATAGGNMVDIQESELARLRETAGRVEALEAERDTEKARADKAEADLAEAATRAEAQQIVAEAFAGIDAPKTQARLVEAAIHADEFDAEAFKTEAEEVAAEIAEAKTGPTVEGFGDTTAVQEADQVSDEDIVTTLKGAR